jgi:hypothetical protein
MMMVGLVAVMLVQGGAAAKKVDIVSVTGCLREGAPNTWMLTNATDPVVSSANAPPASQVPKTPAAGKNEFRLIGVSEFNLPSHKGHTILVKGLHIKAEPVSRLNITSVTMVAPSCAAEK